MVKHNLKQGNFLSFNVWKNHVFGKLCCLVLSCCWPVFFLTQDLSMKWEIKLCKRRCFKWYKVFQTKFWVIFVAGGVSAQNGLDCTSPASSFVSKVSSWIYHSRCPFLLENIDKTKRGPSRFLLLEIDIAPIFPFEGAVYVFDIMINLPNHLKYDGIVLLGYQCWQEKQMTRFQLILPVADHNVTKNLTGHRMHVAFRIYVTCYRQKRTGKIVFV